MKWRLFALMLATVGAVLAVSLGLRQRQRIAILRDLQAAESRRAQSAAASLASYMGSFDRDTRLLSALALRTVDQRSLDAAAKDQVMRSAFQALATVVPHYRTIALLGSQDRTPVVAVDPTEEPTRVAPALVAASAPLAREVMASGHELLRGPIFVDRTRSFYLYGSPVGHTEAVVVSADATMLLNAAAQGLTDRQIMAVLDPSGTAWVGCGGGLRGCTPFLPSSGEYRTIVDLIREGKVLEGTAPSSEFAPIRVPARLSGGRGALVRTPAAVLFPERVVVGRAAPIQSPLGDWSVALIASAAEIDARERALSLQLVLTSMAVIATMLTVGFFIVRQRATAAALAGRLHAAQEVAMLRERSERILENAPVGILGVTRDGRVAMMNRFFQQRITHLEGTNGGQGASGWAARLRAPISRALSSGRTQILPRSGELEDYDVRVVPLERPADDVAALVLVEDLSELRGLQRDLVRAEKLVTVGVLSAGIAHDVGTPLTVIRGRAEHLLERTVSEPAKEDLTAIVEQIDRISRTIRQVLEFPSARPVPDGRIDARLGVGRVLDLLALRLSAKRIVVEQGITDPLPVAVGDSQQFEQVLINLLMNACDASPPGAAISLRLRSDDGQGARLRVELADKGVGIAREHLNAVFDPYFTTKERGEGIGLGLAIVARIVHDHGGEITLESTPGLGTTVTVLWPAVGPDQCCK